MTCFRRQLFAVVVALLVGEFTALAAAQSSSSVSFPPLEQWEEAIKSGNGSLLSLYSTNPPARITIPSGKSTTTVSASDEAAFWTGLKISRVKVDVEKSESPQGGIEQILFHLELSSNEAGKLHTVYVSAAQVWQEQAGQWRIVAAQRTDPVRLAPPQDAAKNIYPAGVDARAEIKEALMKAEKQRKRVLVIFGANWCYDCHVLDQAFERPDVAPVLTRNFEVVHVDVGEGDKNQDLMNEYQVPMQKGIPALAVLDPNGKLIYSQKGGEFERARALTPEDLVAFLKKWKRPA